MSQAAEILHALRSGAKLTPIDALEQFGCFRLAARIQELREEGHPIVTQTVEKNGKSFACYWLQGQLSLLA